MSIRICRTNILAGVLAFLPEDIAAAAGIAKGSIYYNFESKAGLVEAMFMAELNSGACR